MDIAMTSVWFTKLASFTSEQLQKNVPYWGLDSPWTSLEASNFRPRKHTRWLQQLFEQRFFDPQSMIDCEGFPSPDWSDAFGELPRLERPLRLQLLCGGIGGCSNRAALLWQILMWILLPGWRLPCNPCMAGMSIAMWCSLFSACWSWGTDRVDHLFCSWTGAFFDASQLFKFPFWHSQVPRFAHLMFTGICVYLELTHPASQEENYSCLEGEFARTDDG